MISTSTVIMVLAAVVGWRMAGLKSALAFIVCGIFLATTGAGLMVRHGLVDVTTKGGTTVSTVTDVKGR